MSPHDAHALDFDSSLHVAGCTPSHCACDESRQMTHGDEPDSDGCGCGCGHGHGEGQKWLWNIIVPAVIFVPSVVVWYTVKGAADSPYVLAPLLAAYILCGRSVLSDAWEAIRRKDFFNEFTLMSVATLTALGLGQFLEAVGVMLFYAIGENVQDLAASRSRRSIRSLLAAKPESANVLAGDRIVATPPEEVEVGSSIVVKPGERVPLDGTIAAGRSNLDMSSLTGESLPLARAAGDTVYSGSICLDGSLTIVTTARYADSMVSRILALVEGAVERKSKTERFITVFARYYTPLVVLLATLVAVAPPLLLGLPWHVWVYRALVLLVISCPCALVLSVPLAFFGGIGAAAKYGLLVKGGQVFDALVKAKTVIFDKTGTLTEGKFSVTAVEPAPGVANAELLRLAALAESRSNHPLARSIVEAAGHDANRRDDIQTREIPGLGIEAETDEGVILAGNTRLFAERGIAVDAAAAAGAPVHVAKDGRYLGRLLIADKVKKDSLYVSRLLKKELGIDKLYMLTGDSREAAEKAAGEIGLDGFEAGLLPADKVEAFHRFAPNGHAVFVGDGVNDAPVLATAGVGVAMGGLGSAAAIEVADAVILDDSPYKVGLLFKIAWKTRSVVWQNIVFAMAVKLLFIGLGIAGLSGLWEAVFADVGVALLSVLNAVRVSRLH